MKTLLICPAVRPAVPHLAGEGPLAMAPVLGESVAAHWIEHLALQGARQIKLLTADDPELLREHLADGRRWGVRVEIIETLTELSPEEALARYRPEGEEGWMPAPLDVALMSHLPGQPELPLYDGHLAWFAAVLAWMPHALTPTKIRMQEKCPGIWVGGRSRVSPRARLVPPCWVGDQVFVAADAIIGPGAILEDRCVVAAGARVTQSAIGPATYVGPMTAVENSLANGSTLTNWRTGSSLQVPDPFIMCALQPPRSTRVAAALARSVVALGRATASPFVAAAGSLRPFK